MIIVHSWKSLQTTFPTRAMEWFFAWGLLNLGLTMVFNQGLFESSPSWAGLGAVASQATWGNALVIVGTVRLVALLVNGMYWRTPHARCLMAFVSCYFWWKFSLGLIGTLSFDAALVPLCFIFDVYNGIRTGREVGVSEFVVRMRRKAEARHGHTVGSTS